MLCFHAKALLDRHNGIDWNNTQDWLNVFSLMMNPPHDKMKKTATLLNRAMVNPASSRNLDYSGKTDG
jgi:hypothetical protein